MNNVRDWNGQRRANRVTPRETVDPRHSILPYYLVRLSRSDALRETNRPVSVIQRNALRRIAEEAGRVTRGLSFSNLPDLPLSQVYVSFESPTKGGEKPLVRRREICIVGPRGPVQERP